MGICENKMHLGYREHLGKEGKNRKIRKIWDHRGRPDWLKDGGLRGVVLMKLQTGKREVMQRELKAQQEFGLHFLHLCHPYSV